MRLPIRRGSADDGGAGGSGSDLQALRHELDRWPDVFRSLGDALDAAEEVRGDVLPLADVVEADDHYRVEVELPGVAPEDVDLRVTPEGVLVTGKRRRHERVGLFRRRTRTVGRFRFATALPVEVDPAETTASLDHGVLTVVAPKVASARRRRVPVARGARR